MKLIGATKMTHKSWNKRKLGAIAELAGRIGWKGLSAKEYTSEGPLFLSVHALNFGAYVVFGDANHISRERYDESPEIMLRKDDVLICKDGAGIGKVGIVGDLPGPTTINSSLLLIRPNTKQVMAKFLYYSLLSPYFQEIAQSRLQGATTPHLYQRDITEFPIYLPPIPEQDRIVEALDEASSGVAAVIANTERKLKRLSELKQAILAKAFATESSGGKSFVSNKV